MSFLAGDVDPKDPDESKIYTMDWSASLNSGATISSSSWVVQSGLTKVSDAIVTGNLQTSIKLSGGLPNADYQCTNTVVTSDSETLSRTGIVRVRER